MRPVAVRNGVAGRKERLRHFAEYVSVFDADYLERGYAVHVAANDKMTSRRHVNNRCAHDSPEHLPRKCALDRREVGHVHIDGTRRSEPWQSVRRQCPLRPVQLCDVLRAHPSAEDVVSAAYAGVRRLDVRPRAALLPALRPGETACAARIAAALQIDKESEQILCPVPIDIGERNAAARRTVRLAVRPKNDFPSAEGSCGTVETVSHKRTLLDPEQGERTIRSMPRRGVARTRSVVRHTLCVHWYAALDAQETIEERTTAETRPFADKVAPGRVEPGRGKSADVVLLGKRTQLAIGDDKRRVVAFIGENRSVGRGCTDGAVGDTSGYRRDNDGSADAACQSWLAYDAYTTHCHNCILP